MLEIVNSIPTQSQAIERLNGQRKTASGKSSTLQEEAPSRKKTEEEKNLAAVKRKFAVVGGGIAGVSLLGAIAGSLKYGATFPAKALKVVSDAFGGVSAIAAPFFLVGNEVLNFFSRKNGSNGNGNKATISEIRGIFDTAREGFYRVSSAGFIGYIIEPFINPEKFGKSIFHKAATIANIPNVAFSTVMWAGGNLQSLIAWGFKTKEQYAAYNADKTGNTNLRDEHNKKVNAYDELRLSYKRQAVLGSINNPTMVGLRQFADNMALFKGDMSLGEYFERPSLGISRIASLFVGLPEWYAKGVDSVVRVVKERENLKAGLPEFLWKPLDKWGQQIDSHLTTSVGQKNKLKSARHFAEVIFHTLSPLSMFALFTPLLDESHISEEAQSKGGMTALLDKAIGRTGRIFTLIFNGLYVTLGRLPQVVFQGAYFGRKYLLGQKGETEEQTQQALLGLKEKIKNSSAISGISDIAHNAINYLVPDFYNAEHDSGYLSYEQIQTKYAFEEIKNAEVYKDILELVEKYKKEEANNEINISAKVEFETKIDTVIDVLIDKVGIPFVEKDAIQGDHTLTPAEKLTIKEKLTTKIKQKLGLIEEPKRKPLPFIGSDFLATYVFKLFDLRKRIDAIDYRSSHHNMTTAYDNDEIGISFEYELLPVVGECIQGLRHTVNRINGAGESLFDQAA